MFRHFSVGKRADLDIERLEAQPPGPRLAMVK
jgi:hypothetical protein